MGSNFDSTGATSTRRSPPGNVGMYIGGSDIYTNLVTGEQHRPEHLRPDAIPLAKAPKAGVLGGGTLAAVRPDANAAARAAAVKWIDFFYSSR